MKQNSPRSASPLLIVAALIACARPALAQDAPVLLRDIPEPVPQDCRVHDLRTPPAPVEERERQDAARLAASARESALVGEAASARDLLQRAARLDPTSPGIAFLLARTLEQLGDVEGAVGAYCRYLQLAADASDADDARERVRLMAPFARTGIPDSAIDRFRAALDAADAGRLDEAESEFSAVIAVAPTWATPWYNRGVVRARAGRRADARTDLERFLVLTPGYADAERVREWTAQLSLQPRRYSSGAAFVLGLVPGVGHFYTGRPVAGTVLFAAGAGAAAAAVLHQVRHVDCLTVPQNGVCPPDQVRGERVERPLLAPGIGVAAAASLIGAIDAARGARRRNASSVRLGMDAAEVLPVATAAVAGPVDIPLLRIRF